MVVDKMQERDSEKKGRERGYALVAFYEEMLACFSQVQRVTTCR